MKSMNTFGFFVMVFVTLVAGVCAVPSTAEEAPMDWLEEARRALRANGDSKEISRIEILAEYTYLDGRSEPLVDRTIIEPHTLLAQVRHIDGEKIERSLKDDIGYLSGPQGDTELEGEMLVLLRNYFCIRQLQFLILCPGLEVVTASRTSEQGIVRIHREGQFFAELIIDAATHRLVSLRYLSELLRGEATGIETTEYSDFRTVDGWVVPHRARGLREEGESSSYVVTEYQVESKMTD